MTVRRGLVIAAVCLVVALIMLTVWDSGVIPKSKSGEAHANNAPREIDILLPDAKAAGHSTPQRTSHSTTPEAIADSGEVIAQGQRLDISYTLQLCTAAKLEEYSVAINGEYDEKAGEFD